MIARYGEKFFAHCSSTQPGPAAVMPEWSNAVRRGSIDELQRLAAAGADVDARDEHGQTALMVAAAAGHTLVVEWLVGRGAGLDHTAKYGLSALMLAVINGHADIVRTLVRAGANPGLRGTGAPDFSGKTALDLAIARDDRLMTDILREGGQGTSVNDQDHARFGTVFEPRNS